MSAKVREYVRYENRKIHARGEGTAYVSMADLISAVRAGEAIRVVDDVTGVDITARVLARLVYDMSRMADGVFESGKLMQLMRGASFGEAGQG